MLVSTIAPVNGNDVSNIDDVSYVIEGERPSALNIYIESEQNEQAYLEISLDHKVVRLICITRSRITR